MPEEIKEKEKIEDSDIFPEDLKKEIESKIKNDREAISNLDKIDSDKKKKELTKEKAFLLKYGAFKLWRIKRKLKKYMNKEEKYYNSYTKYKKLHNQLSLAIVSGYPSVEEYQKYLKSLTTKVNSKKYLE